MTDRAMNSADLLINKLKKENDNLIHERNSLIEENDRQDSKYRNIVRDFENQNR